MIQAAFLCLHKIVFCSAGDLARMYTTYSHSAAIHRLDVYTLHPDIISTFLARSAPCVLSPFVPGDNGLRTGVLSHCCGISSGQLYFTGLNGLLKNDTRMFGTEEAPCQSSHVRNRDYLTRFDFDSAELWKKKKKKEVTRAKARTMRQRGQCYD